MYSQEEISHIIDNLNDGITVRGNLVADSIMYYGKNIENRKKKIKKQYLALHLGSGRIHKDVERALLPNIDEVKDYKTKKGHICAVLKMGVAKKNSELTKEEQQNKWVYHGGVYDVCNFIEKVYILKNPIKSRGFQSMTWNLECVDRALKQKNKFDRPLKEKIAEELRNITVGNNEDFDMIGQDCNDIIDEYKTDMENLENDLNKIDECINLNGIRKGKVFHVNLTLGEIKQYYEDKDYLQESQIKIEVHKQGVLNSKYYDINLAQLDMDNKDLKNLRVYAFWNSYVSKIMCLDLGEFTFGDFDILMKDLDEIIFSDDENDSDIYEEDMFEIENEMFYAYN